MKSPLCKQTLKMAIELPDELLASDEALKQTKSAKGRLLSPGQHFGGFRVVTFLGRGATSEVWHVRDEALCANFALKVFTLDAERDVKARKRFIAEARLLAQFYNPHIVRVYRLAEESDHPFFTMDLLYPIPPKPSPGTVRRIMLGVLAGLDALHKKGVVHRDIKPSNILLNKNGDAVLTDLGIAHIGDERTAHDVLPDDSRNLTLLNGEVAAIGTPGYGAPEQFAGGDVSLAADIHALGVTLIALFDNHPPLMWRGMIRRMTSSVPILRYDSIADVRRALLWMKVLVYAIRIFAVVAVVSLVSFIVLTAKVPSNEIEPEEIKLPLFVIEMTERRKAQEAFLEEQKRKAVPDTEAEAAPEVPKLSLDEFDKLDPVLGADITPKLPKVSLPEPKQDDIIEAAKNTESQTSPKNDSAYEIDPEIKSMFLN